MNQINKSYCLCGRVQVIVDCVCTRCGKPEIPPNHAADRRAQGYAYARQRSRNRDPLGDAAMEMYDMDSPDLKMAAAMGAAIGTILR